MRLLLVIDSLRAAGAQRQMVNLAKTLHGRGHAIDFFLYHPELEALEPELSAVGIRIHSYPKRRRIDPGVLLALGRLVRSGDYDGVLSFLTAPNLYAELSRPSRDRPVLVVSERNDLDPATPAIFRWLLRRLHHWRADAVVTNSDAQRLAIESAAPGLGSRIHTIRNGVDLQRFRPGEPTSSEPTLLAVGSISPRKNASTLVRALARTREQRGTCPRVEWAGDTGGAAFEEADRLVAELALGDRWCWLGGQTDVADRLRAADALIHPGLREGLSNAICEALASGLPVLAANRFDHTRILGGDGDRGFLFDPEDPDDIARAIGRWADLAPQARLEMGQRARAFAEDAFSLDRLAADYERLFESLA